MINKGIWVQITWCTKCKQQVVNGEWCICLEEEE